MENYILKVKNVNKEANKFQILKDISFELKEGEIVGLIGPNGAGKTSIMKILVGLTKKYSGEVEYANSGKVGCMIETPNFYPYWSGRQNLNYFANLNGVSKERVESLLALLGLAEAANKKVRTYSLGMRQRLGIAQALLTEPQILILDEPTNGLDPEGIVEIREYIRKIAVDNHITVLISSHLLGELEKLCDRAIVIKSGEIIQNIDIATFSNSELSNLVIESPEIDNVIRLLEQDNIDIIKSAEETVTIAINKSKKKEIAMMLAKNGVVVMGMYEESETLEDTFLGIVNA